MKPGGISSTWWVTSTVAGDISSMASDDSVETRSSRPPRSRPGGRLVEQQQLGVGHQRPGDLHPLALALAQGAEGAVAQAARADLGQQARGTVVVELVVASRQRPRTPYDAETTTSRTRSARGIRSASAALVRPMRGRSSKTSTVPRTSPRIPATPEVGWICADATWRSVVLPGTVGSEDDPALVLLDRPVDARDQGRLPPPDRDVGELENGVHVLSGLPRAGSGLGANLYGPPHTGGAHRPPPSA